MDLEGIMPSEKKSEKEKYYMISLLCEILKKKIKQVSEYNKKETDSQIQTTNQWTPVGRGERRGARLGVENKEVLTITYKMKKLQRYIVQQREQRQYLIVTISGI